MVMDEEEGGLEKNGEKVHDKGGEEHSGLQHHGERSDDFTVRVVYRCLVASRGVRRWTFL